MPPGIRIDRDGMTRSEELSRYIEMLVYRMKVTEQTNCSTVSLREMQVISFIDQRGPTKMTEAAEHLLLGLSNLTAIVDKLVSKQFVVRERSDEDRRVVLVSLTREGREQAAVNRQQKHDLAKQMLAALSEAEQEKLLALMRKIVGRLDSETETSRS